MIGATGTYSAVETIPALDAVKAVNNLCLIAAANSRKSIAKYCDLAHCFYGRRPDHRNLRISWLPGKMRKLIYCRTAMF
jgi:hypothetical protein